MCELKYSFGNPVLAPMSYKLRKNSCCHLLTLAIKSIKHKAHVKPNILSH